MKPCNDMVVSAAAYCISNPGREYIIFSYSGSSITANLGSGIGAFQGVWYDPSKGQVLKRFEVPGGVSARIEKPGTGELVLHLINKADAWEHQTSINGKTVPGKPDH